MALTAEQLEKYWQQNPEALQQAVKSNPVAFGGEQPQAKVLQRYNIDPGAYNELMSFASDLGRQREEYYNSLKEQTTQAYTPFGAVTIPKQGVDAEEYQKNRAAKEAEFDRLFYEKAEELGVPTFIEGNYGPQALSPGWMTNRMRESGLNFASAGGENGEPTLGQFVRSVEGNRAQRDSKVDLGDILSLAPTVMIGAAGLPVGGEIFGNALVGGAQGKDIEEIATTAGLSGIAATAPGLLRDALGYVPDETINALFENPVTETVAGGAQNLFGGLSDLLSNFASEGAGGIITNLAEAGTQNGRVSDALLDGLFTAITSGVENREADIPRGDFEGPGGMFDLTIWDTPGGGQPETPQEPPTEPQDTSGGGGGSPSGGGSGGATDAPTGPTEAPQGAPDAGEEGEGSIDPERPWQYQGNGVFVNVITGDRVRELETEGFDVGGMYSRGGEVTGEEEEDLFNQDPFGDTTKDFDLPEGYFVDDQGSAIITSGPVIKPTADYSGYFNGDTGGLSLGGPPNVYEPGTDGTGTDGTGDGTDGTGPGGTGDGPGGTGTGGGLLGGSSADFDPYQSGINYNPVPVAPLNLPLMDYLAMWRRG